MKHLRLFIRLTQPFYLLSAALLYFLGIGIAHYLNGQVNWPLFFLGFAWIIFILLGFQYLYEYFDIALVLPETAWWHTPFSGGSGAIGPGKLPRQVALWAGLTCLTISASLTAVLFQYKGLNPVSTVMLGLILLGELALAIPPFRLFTSGYGEIIMSFIWVGLIPAFAYFLQGHDMHRLLIMSAFPLVTLFLGMLLAFEFPSYATDLKYEKKPIIVKIGWQRGMLLHNIMVLASFILLGIAFIYGLPINVVWPVFFVFPIGLFQIWMMNRIADGAKPNWNLLVLVALSTFGMAAYVLTFAFWTH